MMYMYIFEIERGAITLGKNLEVIYDRNITTFARNL